MSEDEGTVLFPAEEEGGDEVESQEDKAAESESFPELSEPVAEPKPVEGEPYVEDEQEEIEALEAPEGEAEVAPEPSVPIPEELPAEPSKLSQFLRKTLRWATIAVIVFGAGVVATWFSRVRPQEVDARLLRDELADAQSAAASLNGEIESLQGENAALNSLNDDLLKQVEGLEGELAANQDHLDLIRVWVDVSSAQLAMAEGDLLGAKAALATTDERLAELEPRLADKEGEIDVAALRERLALAIEAIDDDEFAARRDLEVLANKLLSIERLLFSE